MVGAGARSRTGGNRRLSSAMSWPNPESKQAEWSTRQTHDSEYTSPLDLLKRDEKPVAETVSLQLPYSHC
jgi:hypothetical protein